LKNISRTWKDEDERKKYQNIIKTMLGFLVGLNILFPSMIQLISAPYYYDGLFYTFYIATSIGFILLSVSLYTTIRDSESVPEYFLGIGNFSVVVAFISIVSYFFLNAYSDRNSKPYIKAIHMSQTNICTNTRISITANVIDEDKDRLVFKWLFNNKIIEGNMETIFWTTPQKEGNYTIDINVSDDYHNIRKEIVIPVICSSKKGK